MNILHNWLKFQAINLGRLCLVYHRLIHKISLKKMIKLPKNLKELIVKKNKL
jgi:hypothetical protein